MLHLPRQARDKHKENAKTEFPHPSLPEVELELKRAALKVRCHQAKHPLVLVVCHLKQQIGATSNRGIQTVLHPLSTEW